MAYLLSTLLIFCTSVFINLLPEKKSLTAFLLGMYITSHANIILSGLILGLFERLSSQTGFLFLEALFLLLTLAVSFKVRANLKWKSSLVDLSAQAGGSALRAFLHAMKLKSDILVKVDGDGQMPLEWLPALLDAIIDDGYDMAKGNRFLSAENLASMPRHGPHIPIKPAGG